MNGAAVRPAPATAVTTRCAARPGRSCLTSSQRKHGGLSRAMGKQEAASWDGTGGRQAELII
jgi:hypothetical protein